MRRRVAITLLVATAVFIGPVSAAGGDRGGFEPRCDLKLERGDSRAVLFHSSCNFEQHEVLILPGRRLTSVRPDVTLSGQVDLEDSFSCGRDGGAVVCEGRAGEGAAIDGRFRVAKRVCGVRADLIIDGGIDCEPGEVCAAIEFFYSETHRPQGC